MVRSLLVLISVLLLTASLAGQASTTFSPEKSLQQAASDCEQSSVNRSEDNDDSDDVATRQLKFSHSPHSLKQQHFIAAACLVNTPHTFHIRGPPLSQS